MENKIVSKFNIVSASYIGSPLDNTVMYVTKKVESLIANLKDAKECLVFCESTIDVPKELEDAHEFILTPNPQFDYAIYVNNLAKDREEFNRARKYTMTETGYTIGENVTIGTNSIVEPFAFIDHDVQIGDNARIFAGARIRNAIIGKNFIAGENCVIGTYGFTMANNEFGDKVRIPTLGKVIIGNDVEVGTLTNVSVGSGGNTIIGDHVKIDTLVHIGHDVKLGKNAELPAGAITGGYDIIGNNAFIGINATLRNRIVIGENSIVGMGSVVTKSIPANSVVVGNPAKPITKS